MTNNTFIPAGIKSVSMRVYCGSVCTFEDGTESPVFPDGAIVMEWLKLNHYKVSYPIDHLIAFSESQLSWMQKLVSPMDDYWRLPLED